MKRILVLLLSLALVLGLAACGGGAGSTPAADTPAATDAPAGDAPAGDAPAGDAPAGDAPAEGGNAVTVWCWDPAFNIYSIEEAAKVYQQANPDFVLNVEEVPWDDIQTRVNTAGASGDFSSMPDIMLMQNNAYQKNVINYPGLFTDLTGAGVAFDQFGPAVVAYSTVDGKNYGVPFDNGTAIHAYRTDILTEAGYTIDDMTDINWNDYLTIGQDVLAKTGKPLMGIDGSGIDTLMIMIQSAGTSLFNEDGTPNIIDNVALKESVKIQNNLIASGVIRSTNNWDEYIASFISGNVAGTMQGCWILGSVQTATDQSGLWDIANLPSLIDTPNATHYSVQGGSSWGVTMNSKNPDLAIDFLSQTFAASTEFYDNILEQAGALANFLPAGDSTVYATPQEFFGGKPIYQEIVTFSKSVPANIPGVYYYEAVASMVSAVMGLPGGADDATIDSALASADAELRFTMGI